MGVKPVNDHFHWSFGNGLTSDTYNPAWKYNSIGNYLLTINCYDSSYTKHVFIEKTYVVLYSSKTSTPIHTVSTPEFTVVPNPSKGVFYVHSKNELPIDYLQLHDVLGRNCSFEYSPRENKIDISPYPAGVYFLRIQSNNQQFLTKIIKE